MMEMKAALKYIIAKICCEESQEYCDKFCPVKNTPDCAAYCFTDDELITEAVASLKAYYDTLE